MAKDWNISNKDVFYIWNKKLKRIQTSMDDVDSDLEEDALDILTIEKSIDIQELNLLKLNRIVTILASPDMIDEHGFHWSILEQEVEELIEYAEWADILASLMTGFLKVHNNDIKARETIRKLYKQLEKDSFMELAEINTNVTLRLATQILK